MKLSAREILEILRLFAVAGSENVPRHIERLSMSYPDEFSVIYTFLFEKRHYFVVIDAELNDDPQLVQVACQTVDANMELEIVSNPTDDTTEYAARFHGKVLYLAREKITKRRLDAYLAEVRPEYSRSTWQKLIKTGTVTVNGHVETKAKRAVDDSDTIECTGIEKSDYSELTLPILFQDANVIVVNKPAGVLTHSKGALNDEFTVAEFFRRFTKCGLDTNRPGIIHRLDRDTSGVIIGALNDETALLLKKQFSERTTKKTYLAITTKAPELPEGIIDIPIGRNPSAPSTFRADINGKPAQTNYEVLSVLDDGRALLKLRPRTGRTHQLRVHLAYLSTPVIGDRVYGKAGERLLLHAYQLEITIPEGNRQTFTAPVPKSFLALFPKITL